MAIIHNGVKTENNLPQLLMSYEKDIQKAEQLMSLMPQVETPSFHHFTDGLYTRETHMPKGCFAIGKCHKFRVTNILLKGKISVLMGNDVVEYEAPCIFTSEAGIKKVAYFHEDTIWLNCHPTNETDLEKIEEEVIMKDKDKEITWLG